MKRYGYAGISVSKASKLIAFVCTEPETIRDLQVELAKVHPARKVTPYKFESGEVYALDATGVRKARPLYMWFMTYLCHHGWEPFSEDGLSTSLRKRHAD